MSWTLRGCENCVFRQENEIFCKNHFLLEKMTEHDELFGKVRSLNKANMEYMRKLEAKVLELEQNATMRELAIERLEQRDEALRRLAESHRKTIKIREETIEDLRGYNKLWRKNWYERLMKDEVPLLSDLYYSKITVSDFQKKRSRVYGFTLEFDK